MKMFSFCSFNKKIKYFIIKDIITFWFHFQFQSIYYVYINQDHFYSE